MDDEGKEKRWPRMGIRVPPKLKEKLDKAANLEGRRIGQFCRMGLNAYAEHVIKKHEPQEGVNQA